MQASYEDEEDAYHARHQPESDDYNHQDTYDQHSSYYNDEYAPSGSSSQYQRQGYQDQDQQHQNIYEDTVTPVREFGESAVPPAASSSRRQFDQVYGYASSSEERYDTPMSSGRLPRDEPILEHSEPEYVYDQNGYPEEDNYGINPTYSEDHFEGQTNDYSTTHQEPNDFRNDYNSSYQRFVLSKSEGTPM